MAIPLLKTKLYIPPTRPELVPRPRLIERLNAGLGPSSSFARKLTLISAPAGFGKTTLLSEWVQCAKRPVAWLSLDQSDDNVASFWRYVVAALQMIEGAIGETAQAALDGVQSQQLSPDALVIALINDIAALSTSFILVLDDYHAIGELAIHESLGYLLQHQPSQIHLVISTRQDPPLPISRLRARGQMTEVRASDLRFTEAETTAFLNQTMRLGLSPEEVVALGAKTEGWIVGLQLAALAMQKQAGRSEFIRAFAGDDRHVMDYLVDEVLCRQPEAVQRFLLQTSILERLCGPLCDAVTRRGDGQAVLDRLERANLFLIPLDNRRYWYRYHHLFAELLRRRLWQPPPPLALATGENVGSLHLRASRWYEGQGFIAEAVSHALKSSDLAHATALVERYAGQMWDRGETVLVHNWLEALPEDAIRSSPYLSIRRAWSAVVGYLEPPASFTEVVEQWLQDAEQAWAARSSDVEGRTVPDGFLGDVTAIRAFLSLRRGGDLREAVQAAHQALARTPQDALNPRAALLLFLGRAYWTLGDEKAALEAFAEVRKTGEAGGSLYAALVAVTYQVIAARRHGQLRQAAAICRDALRSLAEPFERAGRPPPAAGPIYILWGAIMAERGDLEEAERALSRGIELAKLKRAADPYIQRIGYESLIRLKRHQGDVAGALDIVKQVERLGLWGDAWVAAFRAGVWLAQAEHDPRYLAAAARWAEERQIELDLEGRYSVEQLTLARLLIAQHRARQSAPSVPSGCETDLRPLLDALDVQLQAAEERGYVCRMIEALVLKAMALQAQGDADQALSVLAQALNMAEPEGFLLTFVDQGAPMARLLRQAAERGIAPEYVSRLLAAFEFETMCMQALADEGQMTQLPPLSSVFRPLSLVEPLTERELEVLRLIAAGLSNREIAQRLFISPRTVKRHTSNIYGKLGVHSRTQAVAQAQALGILPPGRA